MNKIWPREGLHYEIDICQITWKITDNDSSTFYQKSICSYVTIFPIVISTCTNIYICNSKSVPLMILNYMTNYFFWYISIPWNIDVWTIDVSSKRENLWLQKYHDIYPVNHLDRQISKHIIDDHICLKGNNEGCVLWTEIINLFFTISFLIPHSLNTIVAK